MDLVISAPVRGHGRAPAAPHPDAEQRPWWQGTRGMDGALPPDLFARRLDEARAAKQIAWLFNPHPLQQEILDALERFLVAACGRQVGKTMTAIRWAVDEASRTGGLVWWCAPTYAAAMRGWGDMMRFLPRKYRTVVKSERKVVLAGGGEIQFVSADNPDNLRGETLSGLVIDEAAYVADYVYHDVLMPMLSTTLGRVLLISTPKRRRGFFYDAWRRGQREGVTEYRSWQASSSENPYIPASEIERYRAELPDSTFRREILAEFLDEVNAVFPGIRQVATAQPYGGEPRPAERVIGVDWGRFTDYTVLTVFELRGERWRQVAMERFTGLRFREQLARLRAAHARWGARSIAAETNNFGLPLIEDLQDEGLPVIGITTTAASKADMIRQLQLGVEQERFELLDDPVLIEEFEDFEEQDSPSGRPVFSAPARKHDDIVMSCAMAALEMFGTPGGERAGRFDGELEGWRAEGNEAPAMGEGWWMLRAA